MGNGTQEELDAIAEQEKITVRYPFTMQSIMDVEHFIKCQGLDIPDSPKPPNDADALLCYKLIDEEIKEVGEEILSGDISSFINEISDLFYVMHHTTIMYGFKQAYLDACLGGHIDFARERIAPRINLNEIKYYKQAFNEIGKANLILFNEHPTFENMLNGYKKYIQLIHFTNMEVVIQLAFMRTHKANMLKFDENGVPHEKDPETGKVKKGPYYVKAKYNDLTKIVEHWFERKDLSCTTIK